MKDYEEVAARVLARRDAYVTAQNRRRRHIRAAASATAGLCVIALLGVGAWKGGLLSATPANERSETQRTPDSDAYGSGDGLTEDAPDGEAADPTAADSDAAYDADAPTTAATKKAASTTAAANSVPSAAKRTTTAGTLEGIFIMPRWEEMSFPEQYRECVLIDSGARYSGRVLTASADSVGKPLGAAMVSGYDIYTDTAFTLNGTAYALKNIAPRCAVAVRPEGRDDYLIYEDVFYRPETLGDLIADLDLRETLRFGSIYDESDGTAYYTGISDSVIWEMLLSDPALENSYDQQEWYTLPVMGISVDLPLLGYKNVSMSVSEDGYLNTNILGSGKRFYLGTDKVQAFIDRVKAEGSLQTLSRTTQAPTCPPDAETQTHETVTRVSEAEIAAEE